MRTFILILIFASGCVTPPPVAVHIRDGKGYCPICCERHPEALMNWSFKYQGKTYRFCDPNCREAFRRNPDRYLGDPRFNP